VTTILLARHGESDWNRDRRWQGHADRPLTDLGREQARALADRLAATELDAVYSSDLERARETAAIVAEPHQLPVKELSDLREVDVGSWSGLTRAEAEERYPNAFRRWTEGEEGWDDGETYEQLLADRTAFEDFDIDRARTQGYGFARLQRLAVQHLLGAR
jgi:broad specificity phosphatase PhoE